MAQFVKLTVNLTAEAHAALVAAAERTGHSRTDAVNRALHIYDGLTAALAKDAPSKMLVYDKAGVVAHMLVHPPEQRIRAPWLRRLLGSAP